MKKFYTVLLLLIFFCGLTMLVCADVADIPDVPDGSADIAWGGIVFGMILVLVLVIAVLALAIGLLVKAISRLRNKKKK